MTQGLDREGFGSRLRRALKNRLSSKRLPWVLGLVAVLLTLPALDIGWQLDDHFLRLVMSAPADSEFTAMEGFSTLKDAEANRRYRDLGYLPWWTPDDFRLAFFRPLSLATMRLDYRLWPESAPLMHAHSLLWFGALVAAAALLYRRLLQPAWVAGLAGLLFALDDAHAGPAAWLANRNALLAAFFGVLCLVAHDRWRRDGWRAGVWVAPVLLALGLASGEMALAVAGYLLAYALFLEPSRDRVRSLAPYAIVLALWAGFYRLAGYGTSGSAVYVDPLQSPWVFVRALLERGPFSLLGQWTPVPAELGAMLPPSASRFWWLLAVAVAVLLAAALAPTLRRDPAARFFGLGMLLSLVPISATFSSNRLLLFVGLGGMGLLARFLELSLARPVAAAGRPGAGRLLRKALAWALVATHLFLSPLLLPLAPGFIQAAGEPMQVAAASLGSDPRMAEQDLIVASTPDYLFFVANLPTLQVLAGRPVPRRLRALAIGPTAVELTRIDQRTLRVDLERGLFVGPLSQLFHDAERPLRPGDRMTVEGLEVEVLTASTDRSPDSLLYRFSRPLEHASLRWVRWQDGHYVDFEPPAVGEKITLAPAIGPFDGFLGPE